MVFLPGIFVFGGLVVFVGVKLRRRGLFQNNPLAMVGVAVVLGMHGGPGFYIAVQRLGM